MEHLKTVCCYSKSLRIARSLIIIFGIAAFISEAAAQFGRGRVRGPDYDRGNVPEWELDPKFEKDCFTFVRLMYKSVREASSWAWWTDYPDADLNLSWRLHQLTAMKVAPEPVKIEITDKDLFKYPFAFMSGVRGIIMDDDEAAILRRYMLGGGFIMVDDFWGEQPWEHFETEVLLKIFPDRKWKELGIDHQIFNCVFPLKEKPQIPNVGFATRNKGTGITWEVEDGQTPHYRGFEDDKGRLMMLICHNTDLGDGWEEEATDPYYFTEFSEKKAYPLGINIVFYVMTH
ncbi:MAG TPA: DUF4159 domain-containing protein [Verrucomicrobiae bacterium]